MEIANRFGIGNRKLEKIAKMQASYVLSLLRSARNAFNIYHYQVLGRKASSHPRVLALFLFALLGSSRPSSAIGAQHRSELH